MSERVLPIEDIKRYDGRDLKIQSYDEDGEPRWVRKPNREERDPGEPVVETATTVTLIRTIIRLLDAPNWKALQKADDPKHALATFLQLQDASDGLLTLDSRQHDWVLNVLRRRVPIEDVAKKAGLEEQTLAQTWWGMSAETVFSHLRSLDQRETDA